MIAFDTNYLIRYLTHDDPTQTKIVLEICRKSRVNKIPIYVSLMVICETEWVLRSLYSLSRKQISLAKEALSNDDTFEIGEPAVLNEALTRYEAGKGDLSDFLIGIHARFRGAAPTYTFDKALHREPGFKKA